MEVDGAGWKWVEVDGAGWRWLHGLVIPSLKQQMFTMNNKKQPPEMFYKKAVLKNFSILTGKYLCSSLFSIKLLPFIPATFLKRGFNAGVFL